MTAPAVGIDLGTTYSCVAVYRNGKTEVIQNSLGNRITPSVVSFGTERLIGEPAKEQEVRNAENTVYGVKRLIGRRFNDASADIKQWPFRVVNENGLPKIVVDHGGVQRSFFPEEISAMVLGSMKCTAEAYLGAPVRDAVVTVPAYFNDAQRQATKDAAEIAGLKVLRIINEPTAGALAYGLDQDSEDERHVLIYDLGGGTFDVSVLSIDEGIFEVRATAGDTRLGGEDLDDLLATHLAEEFKRRHRLELTGNKQAMRRLRTACERAKRTLSAQSEASVELDALHEGRDLYVILTRARFEELCGPLLQRTLEPVRQALDDAGLKKDALSDIVLVGGSTRIPLVQKLLRDFFSGRELTQTVNPDEAVAVGAALQAAVLDGDASETVTDLVLLDVTPLSLGTTVRGEISDVIIPRNTSIPVKKEKSYQTVYDFQTAVDIQVVEGERKMSADNNLLGEFTLTGLPAAPAGAVKVKVTFEIDADGILHATAVIPHNNKEKSITVQNNKGRLNKEQIARLIAEAEQMKIEDEQKKKAAEARNELETCCYRTKNRANSEEALSSASRRTLVSKCEDTLDWLKSNPDANIAECSRKKRDLDIICDMVFLKM